MKLDPATLSADAAYAWQVATILPRPIAWTSTLNEDGSANLAPFSFFTGVSSDPPTCLICVSRRRLQPDGTRPPKDTWRNIERSGEYVIHVVNDALGAQMNATSRDFPYGTDEFAAAGLTKVASDKVAPPRIGEALGLADNRGVTAAPRSYRRDPALARARSFRLAAPRPRPRTLGRAAPAARTRDRFDMRARNGRRSRSASQET